ncbi:MAG: carboxypeptidase regulatory-like domain-containing protein, partial [Acidobacteriota bacterium]
MPRIAVLSIVAVCIALAAVPHFTLASVGAETEAATPQATAPTKEAIATHLGQLDRRLSSWQRALERRGVDDAAEWTLELRRFERHLHQVEGRIHQLEPREAAALGEKARAIGRKLGALERAARGGPVDKATDRRVEPVVRQPLVKGVPANDDCNAALLIGNGTFVGTTASATNDGSSFCGGSGAPDVWFRYTSPVGGTIFADTFGSGFDTVLSVHSGVCPGTQQTERTCNDNAIGLQSAVGLDIEAGEEVLIRLSGFGGDSGPFSLHVGAGGAVSGKITDGATGEALAGIEVRLTATQGYTNRSAITDPTGNYTVTGLPSGEYFALAGFSTNFITELYADQPCPDSNCDLALGTPVAVTLGEVTTGIDFSLDLGGSLAGTVTDKATGEPLVEADVRFFDAQGQPIGGIARTDSAGRYSVSGLAAGTYFVLASNYLYRDKVFDDIPCLDCDPTTGTPVLVTFGETTGGVDLALDRLGSITGVVTAAATGEPLPFIDLRVDGITASHFALGFTDEQGRYTVGGLPPGTYSIRTSSFTNFRDEVYDNIPCMPFTCDLSLATPVTVELNATTPGIDFALDRLGSITGVVTSEASAEPLPFFNIAIGGDVARGTMSDGSGRYTFSDLHPGNYFVYTADRSEFQDELYDDIPCLPSSCESSTGTPVPVDLETTTSGIDFALERLGSISGTVTDEATGEPIPFHGVRAQDSIGLVSDSTSSDELGRYELFLEPGTFFVLTDDFSDFQDELYDDIPCPFGDCNLAAGMSITVDLGTAAPGIDFALERLGRIAGTVTDRATGAPLPFFRVEAFDTSGLFGDSDSTDADGRYLLERLLPGTYRVRTREFSDFQDELYDDIPCPFGSCELNQATAVPVSLQTTTEGIDFALERLGQISGRVTDALGQPLAFAEVRVFDTNGSFYDSQFADDEGFYNISGLATGSYFARARGPLDYVEQLFTGIPCPLRACDVTTGTPIPVTLNTTTEDIDFALELGGAIAGFVRSATTGERLEFGEIELWDANGEFVAELSPDFEGRYQLPGLTTATYFVSTNGFFSFDPFTNYNDELYDDLPCRNGGCDPTTGTPVAVTQGAITPGIDFDLTPVIAPTCFPSSTALCLNDDRFQVEVRWRDFIGQSGDGQGFELTNDTGYFYFFDPLNVELVVKVLDGCFDPFDAFWVFAGGLTDVEVDLTVTDTVTGEVRTYSNALGTAFAPIQDLGAFATCDAIGAAEPSVAPVGQRAPDAAAREVQRDVQHLATELGPPILGGFGLPALATEAAVPAKSPGACIPDATTLCLSEGRFAVTALWDTGQQVGDGQAN